MSERSMIEFGQPPPLERSARSSTRNPVLVLPAIARIRALPPEAVDALRAILMDLSADASVRAEAAWRSHKGPMAIYWRSVAVYARHIARAVRP